MIEKRGRLDDQEVDRFIKAGFGKDHALEVIGIVAASPITNYTGSITKTPTSAAGDLRQSVVLQLCFVVPNCNSSSAPYDTSANGGTSISPLAM
jgi:hypothetical protein